MKRNIIVAHKKQQKFRTTDVGNKKNKIIEKENLNNSWLCYCTTRLHVARDTFFINQRI